MTTDDPIHAQLAAACELTGLDPAGARLLHNYSNAIFHLPDSDALVRITVGPADLERVRLTQEVTRWLVDTHSFPATAPLAAVEPVRLPSGSVASFWEYHPQPKHLDYTSADLAALLFQLHTIDTHGMPANVGPWIPLVSLASALAEYIPEEVLPVADVAWLTEEVAAVREALTAVEWQLPPGLIHGDAWAGNLLADTNLSRFLLGDWDWVAVGPREVDLVPTWHAARRYGRDQAWMNAFAIKYGYDFADSPHFELLMRMRDMMQLTGPIRRAKDDQRYLAVLRQRFSGIYSNDRRSPWRSL